MNILNDSINILDVSEMALIKDLVDDKIDVAKTNLKYYQMIYSEDSLIIIESIMQEINRLTRIKARLEVMLEHEENIKEDI